MYLYSKQQIDKAIKRINRFRRCKVYLSEHFGGGLSTVIEVCGLNDDDEEDSKRIMKINKILSEELGKEAHLECANWMCHVCYIGKDDDPEKGRKYNPILLDGKNLADYPDPLIYKIQQVWKKLTEKLGEQGSWTFEESMNFVYDGKYYKMKPLDSHFQSLSREIYRPIIEELLEAAGCTDIWFDNSLRD